jgi:hypothetical protein
VASAKPMPLDAPVTSANLLGSVMSADYPG